MDIMDILQPKHNLNFTKNITTTLLKDGNFSKMPKQNNKKKKNKNKKRCAHLNCNKKLKITDMNCKCHKIFCSLHRLPEMHNCSWNHKSNAEMNLYKEKSGLNHDARFKKIEQI